MQTSYFARYKKENAVSIALSTPDWFQERRYEKLAPKPWFLAKYKEDGDVEYYKEHYYKEVLSKLNAKEVYAELGEDAVLLCWETPEEFCHRHLVAEWLERELGIKVVEYDYFEQLSFF